MQKTNSDILHHFYSLLLEFNFHEDESEAPSAETSSDPFIQKHLRQVKLKVAKARAERKKSVFQLIVQEMERLRKIGSDEWNKLVTPKQALQLQPLFNKFDSLSVSDKESIAEDEELLQLIILLKEKLDRDDPDK